MSVSELKLKIFREIDSLEKNSLEELHRILLNFMNGKRDLDDWQKLTVDQQNGILEAIDEVDSGKEIPHAEVMTKIRKKYTNA
jgi:hypothetical protein